MMTVRITEHEHSGFIFKGNKTNPTHVDQLALALIQILADGIVHEARNGLSSYCESFKF